MAHLSPITNPLLTMPSDLFTWDPSGHIDPETIPDTTSTPELTFPPGLNTSDFDRDQQEIIAAWYIRHLQDQLAAMYRLLRVTAPGQKLTCSTVGINAAIIARLRRLTPDIAEVNWNDIPAIIGVNKYRFFNQKAAVLEELHHVNKHLPKTFKD